MAGYWREIDGKKYSHEYLRRKDRHTVSKKYVYEIEVCLSIDADNNAEALALFDKFRAESKEAIFLAGPYARTTNDHRSQTDYGSFRRKEGNGEEYE